MLSKIVSLACVALAAGQVQIEGSPEWQAWKNAELAHIAPSIGPLASLGRNFAQEQLNWEHQNLIHQQNALNFIASGAGRKKRQVQVVGSPEWQAYKNAELAFIAPSIGPLAPSGRNFAQEQLNWLQEQANWVASGAGRKKRQVQVVGSPEWQAYKNAELAFIAPSIGPLAPAGRNFAQEQLNWLQEQANWVASGAGRKKRQVQIEGSPEWQAYKNAELAFIAPSPGPTPVNYAQSELNFIAPSPGPTPVNYAQSELNFIAPAPVPSPVSYAQSILNYQQEALNFIAYQG